MSLLSKHLFDVLLSREGYKAKVRAADAVSSCGNAYISLRITRCNVDVLMGGTLSCLSKTITFSATGPSALHR